MPTLKAQLVKWGNSHAVRIPKAALEQARLRPGSKLEIRVEEGCITIQPLHSKLTLESLVAGITPENRHQELDWGEPVGNEVW